METKKPLNYSVDVFLNTFGFTDPFHYPVPKFTISKDKEEHNNSNKTKRVSFQKSSNVERIQTVLKKYGFYEGKIDGILGKNTRNGIKEFQQMLKDKGLYDIRVDGIWGRKTQAGLNTLRKIESAEEVTNTFGSKVEQDLARRTPVESRPVLYSRFSSNASTEVESSNTNLDNVDNSANNQKIVDDSTEKTANTSQTTNSNTTIFPKATYFTNNNSTAITKEDVDQKYTDEKTNKPKQTKQVSKPVSKQTQSNSSQNNSSVTKISSRETINHGPITRVRNGSPGIKDRCALWQNQLLRRSGYSVSGDAWGLNNVTVLVNGYSSLKKPSSSNIAAIRKFNNLARDAFARNFNINTLDKHKIYIVNIANNNSKFLTAAFQQGKGYYGTHTALVVYENGQWVAKHSWGSRVRVEPLKDILDNKRSYGVTAISTPNS